MNMVIFYLLAIIAAVSGLLVVTLKNIFHSALFLVLALFSIAGIYVLLGAEFLAAVQVLIYVGAITILMIFAIMLTYQLSSKSIRQTNEQVPWASIIVLIFFGLSLAAVFKTVWPLSDGELPESNTLELGRQLLSTYVIPFEVVSIVLLVALIGAIIISRRDRQEEN
ncbi:MAG: NADH-quinone oxidoreductase subunit J [candidate division Zixibacteria bacterium]|nr:NADH-quinone oxidoreductase subunit J [candidate division Zixibacteria bacterium]